MADLSREQYSEPPAQFAQIPPPNISQGAGELRIIVKELKDDIKDIKSHRHSDFVFHVSVLAAGFFILAGMLVFGYFRLDDRISKTEDKINALTVTLTRVETKLGDLLERIPPVQAPAPAKH